VGVDSGGEQSGGADCADQSVRVNCASLSKQKRFEYNDRKGNKVDPESNTIFVAENMLSSDQKILRIDFSTVLRESGTFVIVAMPRFYTWTYYDTQCKTTHSIKHVTAFQEAVNSSM
jgi:hypothetical protein